MIKQIIKFIIKLFSENSRKKLYRYIQSTINEMPSYNMFQHIELLKSIGFEPKFIIDVGAYVGDWTVETMKIYPDSKYLLIEAQKSKASILNLLADSKNNIFFENKLVGANNKENIKFFDMETGSSIYEENTSVNRKVYYLNMTTLDILASKYNLKEEGFLKLDVQGAEIDILKGANKILDSIEFILLETSTLNYNENAPLVAEVIKYLDEIGYCLFDICDVRRNENNILFQIDLIFVKKNSIYRKKINYNKNV